MGSKAGILRYAVVWVGAAGALGVCLLVIRLTDHPLLLASLGGSCVILFGMPESDMAQPRSLIGGHLLSSLVGLAFLHLGGADSFVAVAAVATALVGMMATRTIHSPAGANPIVIFAEGARWSFLWSPLAIGLVVLLAAALLLNNRRTGVAAYPRRWL
ncbi:MAG: HPP family protein [Dongiaceae bacterium]